MSDSDPQLRIVQLERELQWAQLNIQVLQLELLADEEPSATSDEVEAEARREPTMRQPSRECKPHPGCERLLESLPRVEKAILCEEQTYRSCGRESTAR